MDKDTFTAAVFRRGNKQELLHPSSSNAGKQEDGLSLPEQVTGDEKLEELLKLWSLPRSGFVLYFYACHRLDVCL